MKRNEGRTLRDKTNYDILENYYKNQAGTSH